MGLFKSKNKAESTTLQPEPVALPRVKLTADVSSTQNVPRRRLSYRIANLQGVGTRPGQEDSFAFANVSDVHLMREKGLLAIVCDGMGGMKDGKLASETAVASIRASFEQFDYQKDLTQQLCTALKDASEKVYSLLEGYGGSTAVVCLFYDSRLYYATAGDSYLFLLHRGRLYRVNRLHTVFLDECASVIRKGIVDPSGPASNPEKAAVSSFIGLDCLTEVDCFKKPLRLEGEDVLLLCSDGVGDVLSEKEITDCLSLSTPQNMCTGLEQLIISKARVHQDNYTALVIRCEY